MAKKVKIKRSKRKMKVIDNLTTKYLFNLFPCISAEDLEKEDENRTIYNSFAISVFDRWLTEKEAELILSNYLWKGDYLSFCEEYKISEQKFLFFLKN